MKKILLTLLLALCLCPLSACGRAARIVLPDPSKIRSISISAGETSLTQDDPQYLQDVIERAAAAEPTALQSVSDTPQKEEYVQIELFQQAGASRLFLYEDQGKYYLEQPYQGVWETDETLYEMVAGALNPRQK